MTDPNGVLDRPLIEYTESRSATGKRILRTRTNTGELTKPLQRDIQEILDCTRLTLEAIGAAQSFSGEFADANIRLHPANNRRLPLEQLKGATVERALRSAFRDVMEGVQLLLDDVRDVLAVWSLRGDITGDQFIQRIEKERDRFHRKGLNEKFEHLTKTYGFSLSNEVVEVLDSLNRARNCVVHRRGVIAKHDLEPGSACLRAVWREAAMLAGPEPEKLESLRRVGIGDTISHPDYLVVAQVAKVVEYPLGSRIALSGQDLSDICHTVLQIAKRVRGQLDEHARNNGVPTAEATKTT